MLEDVFFCRYNGYEFVIKEEENAGILYSFKDGKEYDRLELDVNWIVYLSYCKKYDLLLGASYGEGKVFSVKVQDGKFLGNPCIYNEVENSKESRSHAIILDRDEEQLISVKNNLQKLRDAYAQIASQDDSAPVMSHTQTVVAGLTYGRHSLNENVSDVSSDRGFRV